MFKVRFNLGRGDRYMKWQVKSSDGTVEHYDPELVCLKMRNCVLRNQEATAKKILNGANKTVCAWIECESVSILKAKKTVGDANRLMYNPRVSAHWHTETEENLDGECINVAISHGKAIFEVA